MLGELHDLAFLFPSVRPSNHLIDAFAWRVVAGMSEPRDTSPAEAAEGVALLSAGERRRIIRSWAGRYPARWARICRNVGDPSLAEAAFLASAVRGAVADRICPPRVFVAGLEDGMFERSPAAAVAFVIVPETVWSLEEVLNRRRNVGRAHAARTAAQARRLASRLPFDGLPRASATLTEGCGLVADERIARGVADLLFDKYCVGLRSHPTYGPYSTLRN